MEFKGKRILVVCKETFSYPLYYLSKRWMEKNDVAAFFINPSESQYNKCLLNDTTYYKFVELGIPVFTSNDIAVEFTKNLDNPRVDIELLSKLEWKYSHYKNFNQQILSTQYFTRHYHYRNYMKEVTYDQQMYWLQLNYVNIEKIVEKFSPDVVIDTDSAELGRCVLSEVCYKNKIPYLTIEYPRYEMYKTISFRCGYGVDKYFNEIYKECYSLDETELYTEIVYVNDFRNKFSIMSREYSGNITSSFEGIGKIDVIKRMIGHIQYFYDQDFKKGNHKLKSSNPILYPDFCEYVKFYWNYYRRKNKLMKKNKWFYKPIENEKYVYMPLHLIPESSTFIKSPMYIDEMNIIEAISKSLPIGWVLYVKEHQSMVGERGVDFYQRVNRLPNVKMVQLNYYHDPKPWIEKSMGVVTITGTSAYEAALMGKRALVFGDVMFNVIEGITRVDSFESLPDLLLEFSDQTPLDNIKSCAAYIKAVKKIGMPINLVYLLNSALDTLRYNEQPDKDYIEALDSLEMLYENVLKNMDKWYLEHSD